MERTIVGFHQDERGDWVAELSCGHGQHIRHRPPFEVRPWVLEPESRGARVGTLRDCPLCGPAELDAGEPVCLLPFLCPECGAVLDGTGHAPGCRLAAG